MKKTLGNLLDPGFATYRSVGELAIALRWLMKSATGYEEDGVYGTGPLVTLKGYRHCVHVSSDFSVQRHHSGVISWQATHDALYGNIFQALCDRSESSRRWREEKKISLDTVVKVPCAYQHSGDEKEAFASLAFLHGYKVDAETLNTCHPRVNVLVYPELRINAGGIWITCDVTQRSELRHGRSCSRWSVSFLLRDVKRWSRDPKWNPQRETFAAFVTRATEHFRSISGLVNVNGKMTEAA